MPGWRTRGRTPQVTKVPHKNRVDDKATQYIIYSLVCDIDETLVESVSIVGMDLLARTQQSLEEYDAAIEALEQQIARDSENLEKFVRFHFARYGGRVL